MFKTFFASKFKFTHDFISPFTNFSNQGSITIGNYLINYPAYKAIADSNNDAKTKERNKISNKNINNIQLRQKEILENSNWKQIKDDKNSSLERIFTFKEEYLALEFISLVKDKCDEVDHHPSWIYKADQIKKEYTIIVNLTSHFANNNITENDYDLGAFLEYEYEQLVYIYNKRTFRKLVGFSLSLLTAVFIVKSIVEKDNTLEATLFIKA